MTPGDRPRGPLGQFASQVVGLDEATSEAETPAALFRKLREDEFLPDPIRHEALLALAGRSIESGSLLVEEASASEAFALHAQIEQLASEFFDIPIALRADRWQSLAQSCGRHPRLIERLKLLKVGLGIDRLAVKDPSPVVNRLLDDLITLFPLRNEPRASESRARRARFQSDPTLKPADRSRALNRVLKQYPEIAALSHGYLFQLGQPQKAIKAIRNKPQVLSTLHQNVGDRPVVYALLAVAFLGGLLRFANSSRTTKPPPSANPANLNFPLNTRPSTAPIPLPRLPTPTPNPSTRSNLVIRDELKRKIREEISRIGQTIDPKQLDEVVNDLPVEELPNVGGMANLVLLGHWNAKVQARFVDRLKESLALTDLELSDPERDALARSCFLPASKSEPAVPGRPSP